MRKTWCFAARKRHSRSSDLRPAVACGVFVLTAMAALASTPDWMRQAAQTPLQVYSAEVNAVVLLDEISANVSPSGEVHITHRKVFRILRPQGRDRGTVHVYFDNDTRLTYLKAWSITSEGEQYEAKENDAVESTAFSESLYSDTKFKSLQIPASEKGSVIGYEYQQRQRSSVLQTLWMFQDEIPVRRARFVLELPANWSYKVCWRNHATLAPQASGQNRWIWELNDIDAIRPEPKMPNWRSVAGELGLSFAPAASSRPLVIANTWADIGRWYADLTAGRRDPSPEIKAKTQALMAGADGSYEKIRRLTDYVQHDIRYVAIEIGIGGYQPHSAAEVFSNRYGDCKDKATLLSAMLHEAGIESHYVLINSEREFLSEEFPSLLNFNHVVLAIRLPKEADAKNSYATVAHKELGTLLFFDPTDDSTPLGYLPPSLQANHGLLVGTQGELLQLPVLPPNTNEIRRTAKLNVDASGKLSGNVFEVRTGPAAASLRQELLAVPKIQRQKVFQTLVSSLSDGAILTSANITNLDDTSSPLNLEYGFAVGGYGQHPGQLFLFRPCVLGHKGDDLLEDKPRQQAIVFSSTVYQTDTFELGYPADYTISELPESVRYESPFGDYESQTRVDSHVVRYTRTYRLKTLLVPVDEQEHLKEFFRKIADDERSYVILNSSPDVAQK